VLTSARGINLQPLMFDGKESGRKYVELEGNDWTHPLFSIRLVNVVASPAGLTRPPFHEAIQLPFRKCTTGESFGPSWSTHWFRVTLTIPEHFLKKVVHPLFLPLIDSGTH